MSLVSTLIPFIWVHGRSSGAWIGRAGKGRNGFFLNSKSYRRPGKRPNYYQRNNTGAAREKKTPSLVVNETFKRGLRAGPPAHCGQKGVKGG